MKSIRLSLLLYFLALLGLALGGVSALVYGTTAQTLLEKQKSTADLVRTQFDAQSEIIREALDRRLLRQAQMLINKARTRQVKYEPAYVAVVLPQLLTVPGSWNAPVWMSSEMKYHGPLHKARFHFLFFPDITILNAEDYMPGPEDEHPQEFFQSYRPYRSKSGSTMQRSLSLRDRFMRLDERLRSTAETWREYYDDVELDGMKLRRVTVKANVFGASGGSFLPIFPQWPPRRTHATRGPAPRGIQPAAPYVPLPPPQPPDQTTPTFFIQYASDTGPMYVRLDELQAQRDRQLAALEQETSAALGHLGRRLGWIALITFLGIVTGGFLLVRLGLAPLARLSDAVSEVNEKDFRLKIDADHLPTELRPIAGRLTQTLEQLRDAFDREKQAAADISHELRTPLAALMTTVEVALRKKRTPDEYREILEECQLSGRHMAHLVEQLLALARLDAGAVALQTEPVDVAELACQCADLVRPLASERGLTLQCQAPGSILTQTDPNKLRDILINLLHNAVQYNRPQGSIALEVERRDEAVLLEVRDTGIGIAPEARSHIFERFYRADPSRHADSPHCGLGLAIVKSYVDLMGGAIEVESDGGGTTFRVRLPYRAAPADVPAETVRLASA